MLRYFLTWLFFMGIPLISFQCTPPDPFTDLVLTTPQCHWIANDFLYRGGTTDEPKKLSYSEAALEVQFFSEVMASSHSKGSELYAVSEARVLQQIDSIVITSSVSLQDDTLAAGTNLAGKLFTVVQYPNLQLRDYLIGIERFNTYLRNIRRSNHEFYLYLRPVVKPENPVFDLDITFFLNDNSTLRCSCDWVELL